MIKLEHFTNNGFDLSRFLIDYNPSENIVSYTYDHDDDDTRSFIHISVDKYEDIKKFLIENEFIILQGYFYKKNCVINLIDHKNKYTLFITYVENSFNIVSFIDNIKEFLYIKPILDLPKVNLIACSDGDCYLIEKDLPSKIEIDLDNSYNLTYSLDNILNDIKSKKSGLMLFTGDPGTGKSSLIKYLSQINRDVKFCYLSSSNLSILSSPNFTEFCISKLQGCVIVLEDCERALLTRDSNKGDDISNILNITDGIYGDILNIKIIATLNTTDKIDTALLRKGRLICKSEFKKLTIKQGKGLSKSLGYGGDIEINEELQLCEIYNIKDNGSQVNNKKSIGF